MPLVSVNANPSGNPEGAALFTRRFGATAPRDTARVTTELTLAPAGRRGDTLLFVRNGAASSTSGSPIPATGAVFAAYGARAKEASAIAEDDTIRVTLGVQPWATGSRHAPPRMIIGGWPRIVRDGRNVAPLAPADEGTISRNAEVRHPRTAIGFTRDSSTLLLTSSPKRSHSGGESMGFVGAGG
jgi:hypothetical protein